MNRYGEDLTLTARPKPYEALRELSAHPSDALPFLAGKLRAVPTLKANQSSELVGDLDSDDFATRENASAQLAWLGPQVRSTLTKVREFPRNPAQVRHRIQVLLDIFDTMFVKDPRTLQAIRAIWVLERIGTPEAKRLLQTVAAGNGEARPPKTPRLPWNGLTPKRGANERGYL